MDGGGVVNPVKTRTILYNWGVLLDICRLYKTFYTGVSGYFLLVVTSKFPRVVAVGTRLST